MAPTTFTDIVSLHMGRLRGYTRATAQITRETYISHIDITPQIQAAPSVGPFFHFSSLGVSFEKLPGNIPWHQVDQEEQYQVDSVTRRVGSHVVRSYIEHDMYMTSALGAPQSLTPQSLS